VNFSVISTEIKLAKTINRTKTVLVIR